MRRNLMVKVAPLWLGVAALLAACGGGGGDASAPSSALMSAQARKPADAGQADNHGADVSELARDVTQPGVGLDRAKLAHLIEVARRKNRDPEPEAQAQAAMVSLTWIDGQNWFRRVMASSAAQVTPDANGFLRTSERRQRAAAGVIANWGTGAEPARQSDVHWNGNAWVNCSLQQDIVITPFDAEGRNQFDYCDKREVGTGQRTAYEIAGQRMRDVYQMIRDSGATNVSIATPDAALGEAVFPAGSTLHLHVSTPTAAAPAYHPGLGSAVRNADAPIAAGVLEQCVTATATTPITAYTTYATSFENMVAFNRGTPCLYLENLPSPNGLMPPPGTPNHWWGQSTVALGTLGTAPINRVNPTSYYTGNTMLRVGFGAGNTVTYYACIQRYDGSPRNCNAIGTGSYTVATLGDARTMTLANAPAQVEALPYTRVFVERAGKVWLGFRNDLAPTSTMRLDLVAMNALAAQLGMPAVDPEVPLQFTPASYQGDWVFAAAGNLDTADTMSVRIFPNGAGAQCTLDSDNTAMPCTLTSLDGTGNFSMSTPNDLISGVLRMVEGTVAGTLNPPPGSTAPVEGLVGARR